MKQAIKMIKYDQKFDYRVLTKLWTSVNNMENE